MSALADSQLIMNLADMQVRPYNAGLDERKVELFLMNRRIAIDVERTDVVFDFIQYVTFGRAQRA